MSSASNRTPVDFPTRKGMHIGVLRTNKCAYYIIGLIHYVLYKDTIFRKTPLEALADEAPVRTEVAKSAKPTVLQKLHSYDKPSKTEPTKKHKEEVL